MNNKLSKPGVVAFGLVGGLAALLTSGCGGGKCDNTEWKTLFVREVSTEWPDGMYVDDNGNSQPDANWGFYVTRVRCYDVDDGGNRKLRKTDYFFGTDGSYNLSAVPVGFSTLPYGWSQDQSSALRKLVEGHGYDMRGYNSRAVFNKSKAAYNPMAHYNGRV